MKRNFWQKTQKIFLIGIGGISMSGLAHFLVSLGFTVSGSDLCANAQTARLEKEGVRVFIGHDAQNIEGAQKVVVNSAIPQDNPELAEARRRKIPVYGRAELLSLVAGCFGHTAGVAGCHGKTTATAMCAHVLENCTGSCSAHIGGEDLEYGNFYLGGENYFVTEACEYKGNFLHLHPDTAIILNTDADHLDCYRDEEQLAAAYRIFARSARTVIACGEDKISREVDCITFGLGERCDISARNLRSNGGKYSFLPIVRGETFERIRLNVYGKHNVYNALAALALADCYGFPVPLAAQGLARFCGIRRRFELLGTRGGAQYIADYAHHPREILSALQTAKEVCGGRLFVVFQPHTYSRTKLLFADFVRVLEKPENLVLYKTYAAREFYDEEGSARTLAQALPNSLYVEDLHQLQLYLDCSVRAGDTVLFLGAGDIYFIAQRILGI